MGRGSIGVGQARFAVVSTTVSGADEAKVLARLLVGSRLAACVQITPVESIYRWDGAVEDASEMLLLCKIVAADFPAVEAAIRVRHSYEVPEIIMMPIAAGHEPYLAWIGASTAR